jgi:hypothetical protein
MSAKDDAEYVVDTIQRLRASRDELVAALEKITTHWANNYDHPYADSEMYRGPYGIGVVDGHRACSIIANAALKKAKEQP